VWDQHRLHSVRTDDAGHLFYRELVARSE
jgi:hypothetical protein